MRRCVLTIAVLGLAAFSAETFAFSVFLSEINYDYPGSDECEFIEIAVPSLARTAEDTTVSLYNGNNGAVYASETADNFTLGANVQINGAFYDLYYWELPINGIQNGAPDGLSIDVNGVICEFVSYEGTFTAIGGPANGLTSTDIGVSDSNDAGGEGQSVQLVDGSWTMAPKTPGLENVPEPGGCFYLVVALRQFCSCEKAGGEIVWVVLNQIVEEAFKTSNFH